MGLNLPVINERTDQSASLLMLLFLIPFFKPVGWSMIPEVNEVFHIWKIVSLAAMLVYMIAHAEKLSLDVGLVGLIVFWMVYVIDNVALGGQFSDPVNNALSMIGLMLMFRVEAERGNAERMARTLRLLFVILLIVQIITLFVVSGGTELFKSKYKHMYFLGEDNYSAFASVPMMAIVLYCDLRYGENKRISLFSWILLIVLTYGYISVQSVAASVGCLILLVFSLCQAGWRGLSRAFSARKMAVLFGVVLAGVLFFGLSVALSETLNNFIGKSIATLNGRTDIWAQTIDLVSKRPLLGYGDVVTVTNGHAHNILLEAFLRTGFLGAIGFLAFALTPFVRNADALRTKAGYMLIAGFVAYLAIGFFDYYVSLAYFFVYIGVVATVPNAGAADKESSADSEELEAEPEFLIRPDINVRDSAVDKAVC